MILLLTIERLQTRAHKHELTHPCRKPMTSLTRRTVVARGPAIRTLLAARAGAQTKQKLRFSSAFTETDLRPTAYKEFAAAIKDDFAFEPYWGNTLFKQGPELV